MLSSLPQGYHAVVFGATGGIGSALCEAIETDSRCGFLLKLSRSSDRSFDFFDEQSISAAAEKASFYAPFQLMIDATGILADGEMQPEKALKDICSEHLLRNYYINAIGPALLLKHFSPLLAREGKSVFASLSAKVGSIEDNEIGGWYAYRAAKAALNMILKNAAIELGRKRKELIVLGLHPGTVDTGLSRAFSGNIKHEIFSPMQAARQLLGVIEQAGVAQSGKLLAYNGDILPY